MKWNSGRGGSRPGAGRKKGSKSKVRNGVVRKRVYVTLGEDRIEVLKKRAEKNKISVQKLIELIILKDLGVDVGKF